MCDPLVEIESYIYFAALVAEVDRIAPRLVGPPPYPTETMVRALTLSLALVIGLSTTATLTAAAPAPNAG